MCVCVCVCVSECCIPRCVCACVSWCHLMNLSWVHSDRSRKAAFELQKCSVNAALVDASNLSTYYLPTTTTTRYY